MKNITTVNFVKPRNSSTAVALLVAVLAFSAREAMATITYDLRASAVTGGSLVDRKNVAGVTNGSVVTFDLYAIVNGANTTLTDDGYQFSHFGLTSAQPGANITGVLTGLDGTSGAPTGATLNTAFAQGAFARGTPANLTADGVGDIGSNSNGSATGWIKPRTVANDTAQGVPISSGFGITVPVNQGLEYFMGQVKLIITGVVDANSVDTLTFNFKVPTGPLGLGVVGNWRADTVTQSTVAFQAVNSMGVTISPIPEPSAFGMVLIGALGLVGFRRLGFRRAA